MRRLTCIVLMASLAGAAHAESFARRVRDANKTLASGDAQTALSQYRDLQIDEPESDYLHYGVGCARYALGLEATKAGTPSVALDEFKEARDAFNSASRDGDAEVRMAARYNGANASAQTAKVLADALMNQVQLADVDDPKKATVEAFEEAIGAYESFLEDYPDNADARANLDHMRYLLKKLLQMPPPQQQQQKQGGDDEQDKDGEEGEEQDQQEQQENQQQQQDQQGDDKQDQSEQNDDQQKQDAGNEQQTPQEQQKTQSQSKEDEDTEPSAEERQNIEAILQSLEDMDQLEQKDRRTGPVESRPRKEWW